MRAHPKTPALLLACAALMLGACDCENRIRKLFSDDDKQRGAETVDSTGQPVSSDPTEQEPNDTPAQATPVVLGAELRAVLASASTSSDVDWFALSSPAQPLLLELVVDPKNKGLNPAVVLQTASGQQLRYDVAPAGEPEVVPILSVGARALLFRVEAAAGSGDYALRFRKRLAGGQIEAEPNDDAAMATRLDAPTEIQGFHDRPEDLDLYHLVFPDVPAEGVAIYKVQVRGARGLNQFVELAASSAGAPLFRAQIPPEGSFSLPNLAITAARPDLWLRLSAEGAHSRDEPYTISLTRQPALPPELAVDAEPNDTAQQAQRLVMLPPKLSLVGYLHRPEDADYFSLELGASEATPQQPPVKPADSLPDIDAILEDVQAPTGLAPLMKKTPPAHLLKITVQAVQEELQLALMWGEGYKQVAAAGEPVSVCQLALDAGAFAFSVVPAKWAPTTGSQPQYRVIIEDMAGAAGEGGEVEPNDVIARADRLGSKTTGVISTPQDRDVFALDIQPLAQPEGELFAPAVPLTTVTLAGHALDLELLVYDASGLSVASKNEGGAGRPETFAFRFAPGRYFFEVRSRSGASCEPYELSVNR